MRNPQSLKSLKKKLWKLTSEYVRRRDADENGYVSCYTCGYRSHWKSGIQAGHAIGGRKNAVLFDLELLRPQCYGCNCYRQGEQYIFAKKLDQEHYPGWFEDKLLKSRRSLKYTQSDIEDMIKEMEVKLNGLSSGSE